MRFNTSKCVADFNHRCNMYFANFKYAKSNIRNVLFHKYCTAFYGSHVLLMFNSCTEQIYIAWKVAICRMWKVPWTTYCKLLPHLANCLDIELWKVYMIINMAVNSLLLKLSLIWVLMVYILYVHLCTPLHSWWSTGTPNGLWAIFNT